MDDEDTLLSLIGHTLRQNLINITELSNLIVAESDGILTDNACADLTQIKVEALDALSAIDNILHLARHNSVPNTTKTISFASVMMDIVPNCAQKVLSGDSSFCIASDMPVDGSFQGNVVALEDAITKTIVVLHALRPAAIIYFATHLTDIAVVLNFQTSAAQDMWVTASISSVFKKARDVNTLIEMLNCLRLVRLCGGQLLIFQQKEHEAGLTIEIRIPHHNRSF